jgi:hypothetical protein
MMRTMALLPTPMGCRSDAEFYRSGSRAVTAQASRVGAELARRMGRASASLMAFNVVRGDAHRCGRA